MADDGYFDVITFGSDDVVGVGTRYPGARFPGSQAEFDAFFNSDLHDKFPGTSGCPGPITDDSWVEVGNIVSDPFLIRYVVGSVDRSTLTATGTSDLSGTTQSLTYTGYSVPDFAAVDAERLENCSVPVEEARTIADSLL